MKILQSKNSYDLFTETFQIVADLHTPLKKKVVRDNDAPFMTKHLRKAILNRSRCKRKYLKFPSRENVLSVKSVKKM